MEMELMETSNFRLFAADGEQKWQTSIVCCKRKWKAEVCFP
jgi:hypothetical protein